MAPLEQWFLNVFEVTGSFENRMRTLKIPVMVPNVFEHSSLKICTCMTPFDRLRVQGPARTADACRCADLCDSGWCTGSGGETWEPLGSQFCPVR